MVKYTVKIANVQRSFESLHYIRSYELEAQPFEIELPVLESIATGDTIEILRDGQTVQKGLLTDVEHNILDTGVSYIVKAYDLKRKLQFLPAIGSNLVDGSFGYPKGTELKNIVIAQLVNTGLTQGTIDTTSKTYPMIFGSKDAPFDRRRALGELAMAMGWEIGVTPAGALSYSTNVGQYLIGSIHFNRTDGTLKKWVEPYKMLAGHLIEKVTVGGKNVGNLHVGGSAIDAGYTTGDPEITIQHTPFAVTEQCTNLADAILSDLKNVIKVGTMEVIDEYTGAAFDAMDLIKVTDPYCNLSNESIRIAELERWYDSLKGEITYVKLCNCSKLYINAPYILQGGGERALYDTFMAVDNYGNLIQLVDSRSLMQWLQQHWFHEPFAAVDTAIWYVGGTGTATAAHEDGIPCVKITTPATAEQQAYLRNLCSFWTNKDWLFQTKVKLNTTTAINTYFGMSNTTMNNYAFWLWEASDGHIHTVSRESSTQETDLGAYSDIINWHQFNIELDAGSAVKFYIDNELKATHTTEVPSGTLSPFLWLKTTEAVAKTLYSRYVSVMEN